MLLNYIKYLYTRILNIVIPVTPLINYLVITYYHGPIEFYREFRSLYRATDQVRAHYIFII